MKGFLLLIQFMTRLPIFIKSSYDAKLIGKSIKLFPLVGLVIGFILFAIFSLINPFIENKLIVALILVIAEVLITGALHLDGLSDTFDGLFSYRDKKRILEIMKDSCIGVNAALVLILFIIAKILFLSEVSWEYIIIMPVVSRLNTVVHASCGKYARKKGMGKAIVDENNFKSLFISFIITFIITFTFISWNTIFVLFASLLFAFVSLYYIQKRIDGITGDTMGAILELTSLVVLFVGVIVK